jgi:hypothetical protein
VNLTELRQAVVDALDKIPEVIDGTWALLPNPVDAIAPPAFVVEWGAQRMAETQTVCTDVAYIDAVAVVPILEQEANYPALEAMLDAARAALFAAGLRSWQTTGPVAYAATGPQYLSARVQLRQSVTLGGA